MISTASEADRPAVTSALIIAAMSVRPFDGVAPALVIGVTPLVTLPGETPATGARAGSVNSVSTRYAIALIMSVRITASADGVAFFASSSVITTMIAHLVVPSVTVENASAPTGFGAFSPTHDALTPPVCDGTETRNGTLRRFGILPTIVAGRRYSMNSFISGLNGASGPAQVASVVVPAATAALSMSSTSGVESFHRCAYCAACIQLPWFAASA